MSIVPRDNKGFFVPLSCPRQECGGGTLQYEGDGWWRCDGLTDPNNDKLPLQECWFAHRDGEPRMMP